MKSRLLAKHILIGLLSGCISKSQIDWYGQVILLQFGYLLREFTWWHTASVIKPTEIATKCINT